MAVNAHTHLYSGLAPLGMPAPSPPPETFLQILERVWWRLDRALDPESLRASADLYVAEALAFGTTGLVDHHESPRFVEGSLDVLAEACQDLGMPAVLCYGATERNGGLEEARRGLAECARLLRDNRRPLVRGVVGLHASFTVSDETIERAATLAREHGTVLHVHVAEDRADVHDAVSRGYAGVVARLAEHGALIPGSIFAHGVHLTADEVRVCEDAGVWLVQNPRSNKGNQVGYPLSLSASRHVALGTDGWPSDMAAEEEALWAEAGAVGDDFARVAERPSAGQAILAQRFDALPSPTPGAADRAREALPGIRQRAREAAGPLWSRMLQL